MCSTSTAVIQSEALYRGRYIGHILYPKPHLSVRLSPTTPHPEAPINQQLGVILNRLADWKAALKRPASRFSSVIDRARNSLSLLPENRHNHSGDLPQGIASWKVALKMRVTFDTNVWNRVVFPERYMDRPNHSALLKINTAVQGGVVRGFICESFATQETIRRTDRASYHAQNVPKVEVKTNRPGPGLVHMTIEINAEHDKHPGLSKEFEEELDQALAIGMKLLSTPYIGLRVPNRLRNNPHIYAPEVFATADYNERFGDVAGAVLARGIGEGALVSLAKEFTGRLDAPLPSSLSDRELIRRVYDYACTAGLTKEKRQVENAFAEAADGDVVAAHVAFGTDYLCTDDRGESASGSSVFDDNNRAWLKTTYGIEILSAQQLSGLLEEKP